MLIFQGMIFRCHVMLVLSRYTWKIIPLLVSVWHCGYINRLYKYIYIYAISKLCANLLYEQTSNITLLSTLFIPTTHLTNVERRVHLKMMGCIAGIPCGGCWLILNRHYMVQLFGRIVEGWKCKSQTKTGEKCVVYKFFMCQPVCWLLWTFEDENITGQTHLNQTHPSWNWIFEVVASEV